MRRFRALLLALAFGLAAAPASASPSEVARAIPNAQKVGEARYHMLSVALFDAELYTASGDFSWSQPFALSLTYQRSARQSTVLNRTIREMSQRGAGSAERLAPLRAQLARCFSNVERGDRMTGLSTGPNGGHLSQRRPALHDRVAELPPPLLRHLARGPRRTSCATERAVAR